MSDQLELDRTLFVFASKSGKRIETHALLLYFLNRLRMQRVEPGRCFVAVTEEDSYLSELARNYDFLGTFLDPPGIKGRYSSLIHFGLLLSAVWRIDPQELVIRAKSMRELCKRAPGDGNPAAELAAFSFGGLTERQGQVVAARFEVPAGVDLPHCATRRSKHEQGRTRADSSLRWLAGSERGRSARLHRGRIEKARRWRPGAVGDRNVVKQ